MNKISLTLVALAALIILVGIAADSDAFSTVPQEYYPNYKIT